MLWFYLTAFVLLCAAELAALLVRLHKAELMEAGSYPPPKRRANAAELEKAKSGD
jgi:uncharacterized BrkB/YihY/UPF0761 family membrane protein